MGIVCRLFDEKNVLKSSRQGERMNMLMMSVVPFLFFAVWLVVIIYVLTLLTRLTRATEQIAASLDRNPSVRGNLPGN